MQETKTKLVEPDRNLVFLYEIYDVYFWMRKFGVSADELKRAVKFAGHRVQDVEEYFKRTRN